MRMRLKSGIRCVGIGSLIIGVLTNSKKMTNIQSNPPYRLRLLQEYLGWKQIWFHRPPAFKSLASNYPQSTFKFVATLNSSLEPNIRCVPRLLPKKANRLKDFSKFGMLLLVGLNKSVLHAGNQRKAISSMLSPLEINQTGIKTGVIRKELRNTHGLCHTNALLSLLQEFRDFIHNSPNLLWRECHSFNKATCAN